MARSLLPLGAGEVLPVVPRLPNGGSFLTNFVSLLEDLLGSVPGLKGPAKESPEVQAAVDPPAEPEPRTTAEDGGPIREFGEHEPISREDLRREIERRLSELPPDQVAAHLEEIRRYIQSVAPAAPEAPKAAEPLPPVVEDALRSLHDSYRAAPPPAPVTFRAPAEAPAEPPATAVAAPGRALHSSPAAAPADAAAPGFEEPVAPVPHGGRALVAASIDPKSPAAPKPQELSSRIPAPTFRELVAAQVSAPGVVEPETAQPAKSPYALDSGKTPPAFPAQAEAAEAGSSTPARPPAPLPAAFGPDVRAVVVETTIQEPIPARAFVAAPADSVPATPAEPPAAVPSPTAPLPVAAVAEAAGRSDTPPSARGEGALREIGEARSGAARASRAAVTAPAPGSDAADRADLIERVVRASRLAQSRGAARIRIVLEPPELGQIKVDLAVRQHVVTGKLQAESAAARDLILAHLGSLKEALESQGIPVGDFQVNVENAFEQAQREAERGHGRREAPERSGAGLHEEPAAAAKARSRPGVSHLIDVVA